MKFKLNEIKNNYFNELGKIKKEQITELGEISKFKNKPTLILGGSVYAITDFQNKIIKNGKVPLLANKDIFYRFLEEIVDKKINFLRLNFAWPILSFLRNGYPDGKLITGTKEHDFDNLTGKIIGKGIEKYLWKKRKQKIKIVVLNDVVSLVLNKKSCLGGVIGTGMNFGFWINDNSIVNLEAGNFGNFEMSETGKQIDKSSINPGKYKIEKEVGGAYLYKHFNLLSENKINSTKELNEIAKNGNKKDKKIAEYLLERSASLVATLIAAIIEYSRKEKVEILIEGSLFWQGYLYEENIYKYLEILGINKNKVKFLKVKDL
jgi:hexokinase